eukprot:scaffold251714_cov27-Tisochrysis_lutea.AAC.1
MPTSSCKLLLLPLLRARKDRWRNSTARAAAVDRERGQLHEDTRPSGNTHAELVIWHPRARVHECVLSSPFMPSSCTSSAPLSLGLGLLPHHPACNAAASRLVCLQGRQSAG